MCLAFIIYLTGDMFFLFDLEEICYFFSADCLSVRRKKTGFAEFARKRVVGKAEIGEYPGAYRATRFGQSEEQMS